MDTWPQTSVVLVSRLIMCGIAHDTSAMRYTNSDLTVCIDLVCFGQTLSWYGEHPMRKPIPPIIETVDDLKQRLQREHEVHKKQRLQMLYLLASGQV